MPTPSCRNGTYIVFRKLHTRVAAYRHYLRAKAASREEEALLGAKMVGRWQSGAPLALSPDATIPSSVPIPRATTTSSTTTICAGSSAWPARTRDARTRATRSTTRQRQRPPAPHDPARHELRPDAARRRARGRRRRSGIIFVFVGAHLKRQFEFVKTQWLNDGIFIGAPPRRTRSSGRTTGRARSPSRSGRSGAACRACRRSSSPAAASTRFAPGLRVLRWLAELET